MRCSNVLRLKIHSYSPKPRNISCLREATDTSQNCNILQELKKTERNNSLCITWKAAGLNMYVCKLPLVLARKTLHRGVFVLGTDKTGQ